MIGFVLKSCCLVAIVIVSSLLLINTVPSLKANILEVVNPRVEEGKLVQKLQETLTKIDTATRTTGAGQEDTDALIKESKELLQSIADINEEHSGVASGIVSKVADVVFGAESQTTVTVTVSPPPCK